MQILVPTDFSKNATHATRFAAEVGKATDSAVKLLCVINPALSRNNIVHEQIETIVAQAEQAAHAELTEFIKNVSGDDGSAFEKEVRVGGTVDEIVRSAKEGKVDLIIMGTKGASGLEKFLFGSNTAEVIESTPCPVLAVPVDAPVRIPQKIVFATNYHDSDLKTLTELSVLVQKFKAELIVLHVSREPLKSDRDLIEQFAKTVATETGLSQPYYYVLPHHDIQQGINSFIDSVSADMIALSTRKRNVFERLFDTSLTKKIAYQARLPLLAFHATETESDSVKDQK